MPGSADPLGRCAKYLVLAAAPLIAAGAVAGCGPAPVRESLADCQARAVTEADTLKVNVLPLLAAVDRKSVAAGSNCADDSSDQTGGFIRVAVQPGTTTDQVVANLASRGWSIRPGGNNLEAKATRNVGGNTYRVFVDPDETPDPREVEIDLF